MSTLKYWGYYQSLFNVTVRNPIFFAFFFGSGVIGATSIALNIAYWRRWFFWVLLFSTILYIAGIIFYTKNVNLPLNYYTESWDPLNLPPDWDAIRESWNQANLKRVWHSAIAFGGAIASLVLKLYHNTEV